MAFWCSCSLCLHVASRSSVIIHTWGWSAIIGEEDWGSLSCRGSAGTCASLLKRACFGSPIFVLCRLMHQLNICILGSHVYVQFKICVEHEWLNLFIQDEGFFSKETAFKVILWCKETRRKLDSKWIRFQLLSCSKVLLQACSEKSQQKSHAGKNCFIDHFLVNLANILRLAFTWYGSAIKSLWIKMKWVLYLYCLCGGHFCKVAVEISHC